MYFCVITVYDATGRYSAGFLWGNNYWLGSSDQCVDLASTSPVAPAFSVARLAVRVDRRVPQPRSVHVGVCLPRACALADLRVLVAASAEQRNASLETLRSPQLDDYAYYADGTFIVLALVSGIVAALMVAGSVFDARKPPPPPPSAEPECENGNVVLGGGKPPIALDVLPTPKRKLPVGDVLLCFSVQRNARAIFDQVCTYNFYLFLLAIFKKAIIWLSLVFTPYFYRNLLLINGVSVSFKIS